MPSRAALRSRSSIGSIASSSAISSSTDSTANVGWQAPGARYEDTFGLFTTTS